MTFLFAFMLAVMLIALAINLSDINPFQEEDLPMLDQIEAVMLSSHFESEERGSLDLAA